MTFAYKLKEALPEDISQLDLTDSGEALDSLYDQFLVAKSKSEKADIISKYKTIAEHHNRLAGFKRYSTYIQKINQ